MNSNESVRERSGAVESSDPRVAFLYLLMRDHLPAGIVDNLIKDINKGTTKIFTNGWLAKYAIDLVERIDNVQNTKE